MIKLSDITFVVQGSINHEKNKGTKEVLLSIKKHYPNSKIILSTWIGEDVEDLYFDKVIFNSDPGTLGDAKSIVRNLNRQIVSSLNGLKQVETKYAVKTRTDIKFYKHFGLLNFKKFGDKIKNDFIEGKRFVITDVSSVNPESKYKYAFHFCDWLVFAKKELIINLFNIPLCSEKFANWYANRERVITDANKMFICKYYSETYIWKSYYNLYIDNVIKHGYVTNFVELKRNHEFLTSHLILLSNRTIGFISLKYHLPRGIYSNLYSEPYYKYLITNKNFFLVYIDRVFNKSRIILNKIKLRLA